MSHLLRHVLSASSSLDVCMFAFTNTDLSRALLALRGRGVAVRVLVEEKSVSISGSQIPVLLEAGKRVRPLYELRVSATYLPPSSIMRHPQTQGGGGRAVGGGGGYIQQR